MRSAGYQPAEPLNVWAVTDGRAGIEAQALGLAEAIARRAPISLSTKRVRLRTVLRLPLASEKVRAVVGKSQLVTCHVQWSVISIQLSVTDY